MTDKKWSEPKGKEETRLRDEPDEISVRELELFVENDDATYRQRMVPVIKNLARKKYRGIYNHNKAVKAMMYAVNDSDSNYDKEFGYSFPIKVKRKVAENLVDYFEQNFKNGEYSEYQQKYLKTKRRK